MQTVIHLVAAQVRRDAQTTTPVTVLAHELPLLYDLYGRENVTVDETAGRTHPVDTDGEYQRLANKYGIALVEEVYGRESSGRLADAIERAAPGDTGPDSGADTVRGSRQRGRKPKPPVLLPDESAGQGEEQDGQQDGQAVT